MKDDKQLQPDQTEKYSHESTEPRWIEAWDKSGIYRWKPDVARDQTFVVDTPPPTVSGSLHVGHIFSYTQTDVVVRYQRMRGKNIFYPMGWDDNGLPTERRVQNYYNITCSPHLQYDPMWQPVHKEPAPKASSSKSKGEPALEVSRRNFIEACMILTRQDEEAFEQLFRRIGHSYDWTLQYSTISDHCRRISQLSFVDLVEKNLLYSNESPTMWDVTFRSAVAQAEIEDRVVPGAYYDIRFAVQGGGEFTISTTRPELLSACIAVVAHPDDERYKPLFGKFAVTPLFHAPVPIQPAPHADPEKGTGIMMVCTFGDIMDVAWWKQTRGPLKQIFGLDGRLLPISHVASGADSKGNVFTSINPEEANQNYGQLVGLTVKQAHNKTVELLSAPDSVPDGKGSRGTGSALVGEAKPITHPVKFYEKGDRPIEFIPTRQWFIKVLEHKQALIEQGRKIQWHPDHMLLRYEHWVEGLNQDWCISRQRYFGVPVPVWYALDANSRPNYANPIFPTAESLPIDPLSDCPPGYREQQRGQPNGFMGDPDVMDTWATSALTPQIASHWLIEPERHAHLFPMDLRPQAHDIIRTWAFVTITKAWMHENKIPWKHAAISGFIMDPDRKKMSKSRGNVVTPQSLIEEHSADAVRYWASRAKLGQDTPFDESLFKIGKKLTTKIFNASRFVRIQFERLNMKLDTLPTRVINEEIDRSLVQRLRSVITEATECFDNFEYSAALQNTEDCFWNFCDHYLELVKVRAYQEESSPGRDSSLAALSWSLKTFLRLFAPFVPFVTEEVWATSFAKDSSSSSIHAGGWPSIQEVASVAPPQKPSSYDAAIEVISKIRGAKTDAKKNLRWEVLKLELSGAREAYEALSLVMDDIVRAGAVRREGISFKEATAPTGSYFETRVELAPE